MASPETDANADSKAEAEDERLSTEDMQHKETIERNVIEQTRVLRSAVLAHINDSIAFVYSSESSITFLDKLLKVKAAVERIFCTIPTDFAGEDAKSVFERRTETVLKCVETLCKIVKNAKVLYDLYL